MYVSFLKQVYPIRASLVHFIYFNGPVHSACLLWRLNRYFEEICANANYYSMYSFRDSVKLEMDF